MELGLGGLTEESRQEMEAAPIEHIHDDQNSEGAEGE